MVNKYIPPDFDPKLVPKGSRPKDECVPVRMMLPFTIHCNCNSFQYKGTKYNAKKEPMKGMDGKYLGIQRFRFILKCTSCLRPLTFLTDPKNADYEMESGGTRTYEVQKDKQRTEEEVSAHESVEEKIDPMKALEKRVLASQREMADLDNLEEIKALNMRNVKLLSSSIGSGGVLHAADVVLAMRDKLYETHNQHSIQQQKEDECEYDEEEEERLIQSIRFGKQKEGVNEIQRLDDRGERWIDEQRQVENEQLQKQQEEILSNAQHSHKMVQAPIIIKKKKKRTLDEREIVPTLNAQHEEKDQYPSKNSSTVLGMIGEYDSD